MAVKKKVVVKKKTWSKAPAVKVGTLIDELYLADKEVEKVEGALRKKKEVRDMIEAELLKSMNVNELNGARGKLGTAFVKESKHPSIVGPNKFWKFVVANKAYDLLHKRVASRAYFDRLEGGIKVPGIKVTSVTKVNVRKSK